MAATNIAPRSHGSPPAQRRMTLRTRISTVLRSRGRSRSMRRSREISPCSTTSTWSASATILRRHQPNAGGTTTHLHRDAYADLPTTARMDFPWLSAQSIPRLLRQLAVGFGARRAPDPSNSVSDDGVQQGRRSPPRSEPLSPSRWPISHPRPHAPLQLRLQDPVIDNQMLIPQRQLLIHDPGDVCPCLLG
jgi:hypothetical protein